MMGGVPASGKSTIVKRVIHGLEQPNYVEPLNLFPCQRHGDVLVVGRYPEGEPFGGTDRLSYGAINQFSDFILQEYPKHRHIVIEGDRFFQMKNIEWLVSGYDARVFVLQVSPEELKRRHIYREDSQTEKWLKGRNTQIQNILTNLVLMGQLQVRTNETDQDTQDLVREINGLLFDVPVKTAKNPTFLG
jgi:hypothetical protein